MTCCCGLPRNRVYLVEGSPGIGKTTLALQFLLHGLGRGEKGLYITLSETREELVAVAKSHGWSLDSLPIFELSAMEKLLAHSAPNTLFHPADLELGRTIKILCEEVERVKPERLALDSLSELRLLSENSLRYRRQMLALKQFFAGQRCTVLLLDDHLTTSDTSDLQVQSIAHGVISLEKRELDYGAERRRIRVRKLRGVKFRSGKPVRGISCGRRLRGPSALGTGWKSCGCCVARTLIYFPIEARTQQRYLNENDAGKPHRAAAVAAPSMKKVSSVVSTSLFQLRVRSAVTS